MGRGQPVRQVSPTPGDPAAAPAHQRRARRANLQRTTNPSGTGGAYYSRRCRSLADLRFVSSIDRAPDDGFLSRRHYVARRYSSTTRAGASPRARRATSSPGRSSRRATAARLRDRPRALRALATLRRAGYDPRPSDPISPAAHCRRRHRHRPRRPFDAAERGYAAGGARNQRCRREQARVQLLPSARLRPARAVPCEPAKRVRPAKPDKWKGRGNGSPGITRITPDPAPALGDGRDPTAQGRAPARRRCFAAAPRAGRARVAKAGRALPFRPRRGVCRVILCARRGRSRVELTRILEPSSAGAAEDVGRRRGGRDRPADASAVLRSSGPAWSAALPRCAPSSGRSIPPSRRGSSPTEPRVTQAPARIATIEGRRAVLTVSAPR